MKKDKKKSKEKNLRKIESVIRAKQKWAGQRINEISESINSEKQKNWRVQKKEKKTQILEKPKKKSENKKDLLRYTLFVKNP